MANSEASSPLDIERRALRARMRALREGLSAGERIAAATALVEALERIPEFMTETIVAGYWAVTGELPLMGIVEGLRARDQRYVLPRIEADRTLRFAPWHPGVAVVPNRFGIPEPQAAESELIAPADVDVVLIPLVGFDRRGHRLGFGGGYYDRSFAFLRDRTDIAKPVLVGVGYAAQELPAIEAAPWDVALDYVATERELVSCWPDA